MTLRECHRLKVFEDRILRRIFGPRKDAVVGGLRKLQINVSMICTQFKKNETGRACSKHDEGEEEEEEECM
jgi:hypothetical protein